MAYEGDPKTNQARLMNLKHKYEHQRMLEDESVDYYIHTMTDLANGIKAVGGHFEECDAHKILLTLPKSYKPQRCVIQESNNLSEYTIDRHMGTLVAYEISEMEEEKREKKEAGFSVSRHDDPKCSGDLEEAKANFVRRWQRGTGKCEGKLPLKCFSCGRIGHYSSSYTNREDYKRPDDDEKKKKV